MRASPQGWRRLYAGADAELLTLGGNSLSGRPSIFML